MECARDCEDELWLDISTIQILDNVKIDIDDAKGKRYFEGSTKFVATLQQVLNLLTNRVRKLAQEDLYQSNISQIWGVALLLVVTILSPLLIVLAKNAISSIQLFATSVEKKSLDMKRQKVKQEALIYKMLPKMVVEKLNSGEPTAESFESATLYFSSVCGFDEVTKSCR